MREEGKERRTHSSEEEKKEEPLWTKESAQASPMTRNNEVP